MLARLIPSALFLLAVAACADHDAPTAASSAPAAAADPAPPAVGTLSASARADEAHLEALARRVALALRDSAFRAYVRTALDRSPFAEHKLQFQRFLQADGGRALTALAAAAGEPADAVAAEAAAAVALEIYLPVPAHRAAWSGDANLLVATAIEDHEAPIAFDVEGRRQLLDADRPPATPVIAVVPVETDFDRVAGPARMQCATAEDCTSGGGGTTDPSVSSTTTGLYLTYAQYSQDFEGIRDREPIRVPSQVKYRTDPELAIFAHSLSNVRSGSLMIRWKGGSDECAVTEARFRVLAGRDGRQHHDCGGR